ncbi:MAG: hypothetical protein KGO92_03290 [Bacteroidota bacterium]|nr:hypothetical protein [Bacteroidota bacterium]
MFNPFLKFELTYIDRLLRLDKRYLVTQTYTRADDHFGDDRKTNLLLSDYADLDYARIHKDALKDPFAAIIDLKKNVHREKLVSMLCADAAYVLWWAVIKDPKEMEHRMNQQYAPQIRRLIRTQTDWRVGSDEVIKPKLACIFGELFLILKRGGQVLRVKWEDLEKS